MYMHACSVRVVVLEHGVLGIFASCLFEPKKSDYLFCSMLPCEASSYAVGCADRKGRFLIGDKIRLSYTDEE